METADNFVKIIEDIVDRKLAKAGILNYNEGVITAAIDNVTYEVLVRGITYEMKSATGFPLNVGEKVIVFGNERKRVIVGRIGGNASGGTGADGKSAYEIAVEHGFVGTEQEWLDSLQGQSTIQLYEDPTVYVPGLLITQEHYGDLMEHGQVDEGTAYLIYEED